MRRNSSRRRKIKYSPKTLVIGLIILSAIFISLVFILQYPNSKKVNISNSNSVENSENTKDTENSQNDETSANNTNNTSSPENTVKDNSASDVKVSEATFNMLLTGDIMCHDTMYKDAYNSADGTYDFLYMFDDIKYYTQTADITVGNLETTFAGTSRPYSNYPTFNTPDALVDALKKVGFDVVSTANNHCMDSGYKGLERTLELLDKNDISHTGTFTSEEEQDDILIKNVKGVRIAFLSYTYGTNGIPVPKDKPYAVNLIDKDLISKHLELAKKKKPDMICVSMHWGIEYQTKPNKEQKDLADFLFENGVDVIIGNHPHVPQNMEKRTIELSDGTKKDGFIIYSLGNFMADQNKDYTHDSALLNLNITRKSDGKISINTATYTPIYYLKNKSVSKKRFKFIDIEKSIAAYEADYDTSIGKTLYNTLKTELKNIRNIIGDEIK